MRSPSDSNREGFDVAMARDGQQAVTLFAKDTYDIVLLDLMLAQDVRTRRLSSDPVDVSEVPIIIVSAKGEEVDMVLMLEIGADDYVTKPYRLRELVARIRAVLRRRESHDEMLAPTTRSRSARSEWTSTRAAATSTARRSSCARRSSHCLRLLLENPGRVLTREVLIDRVWGSDYVGDTKTLDVHIKRLRSLIEDEPEEPRTHHDRARCGLPLRGHEGVAVDRRATAQVGREDVRQDD